MEILIQLRRDLFFIEMLEMIEEELLGNPDDLGIEVVELD